MKKLKPIKDYILVTAMNFGERKLSSGLVLLSDDKKSSGIRARWGKVYAIGPEQKDVTTGQWVLVEHGRWTRGILVEIDNIEFTIRRVDPSNILLVSNEEPSADDVISTAVHAERKERNYE